MVIDRVEPTVWIIGQPAQIVGFGFGNYSTQTDEGALSPDGDAEGETAHTLYISGQPVEVSDWTNERITFVVPPSTLGAAHTMVWHGARASNAYPIHIVEATQEGAEPTESPDDE